ncbi:MAG: Tol-Pal system beta propeller repeat protein TolB [Syntrophales bacterium]|nr:Tol-Pal system beta propeller repeat protein TolB [Syntrophales bacterium]
MRRHKFFAYILVFLLLYSGHCAYGRVYLDIDSPSFQKFPIAITDFKELKEGQDKENFPAWFSGALGKCLEATGLFNVIGKRAFLENKAPEGLAPENIQFTNWKIIGAEYLVKGALLLDGGTLVTEFRLYDVIKGSFITGKRYTGKIDSRRDMVLSFAGEILQALTGNKGVFDTKIAFALKNGKTSDIYTVGFDGSNLTRITDYQALTLSPRWSPDGRHLSLTSYKNGMPELYILDLSKRTLRKVASFRGLNLSGAWSSDGQKILMTLSRDGNEEIYVMYLQDGQFRRLTNNFAIDVSPTWSPDGRKIAFVSNRSGSPQIYLMDADGRNIKRLSYEGNYNTSPSWSPPGDKIAYEGRTDGVFQIFSIEGEGTKPLQLTSGKANSESPSWSPDGRYIAFHSRKNGRSRVCVINADGSNMRVLYEGMGECLGLSWSPKVTIP